MADQLATGIQWVVDDSTGAVTGYRRKINGVDTAFALSTAAIQASVSGAGNFVFDTTAVTGAANTTEQVLKQYVIPADAITASHYVRISFLVSKSGTAEAMTLRFRIGTAGTTADAQLASQTAPNSASRSNASEVYFFASSSTQLRHLGSTPFAGMVGGNSSTVIPPVNVTVPDMTTNALILSVTAQMATGAETPTINHVVIEFK